MGYIHSVMTFIMRVCCYIRSLSLKLVLKIAMFLERDEIVVTINRIAVIPCSLLDAFRTLYAKYR